MSRKKITINSQEITEQQFCEDVNDVLETYLQDCDFSEKLKEGIGGRLIRYFLAKYQFNNKLKSKKVGRNSIKKLDDKKLVDLLRAKKDTQKRLSNWSQKTKEKNNFLVLEKNSEERNIVLDLREFGAIGRNAIRSLRLDLITEIAKHISVIESEVKSRGIE